MLMSLKHRLLQVIRTVHLGMAREEPPARIAIYGHKFESEDWQGLEETVSWFRTKGYVFTGVDEFLDFGKTPERVVFLSFDDNFRSWWQALPLFERLDIRVTFYVNPGVFRDIAAPESIDRYFDRIAHDGERITLSTEELLAIHRAGHTIGSHTDTHPLLTTIPRSEAMLEMRRGKEKLESLLGAAVPHFSFPFGMRRHFSESLRAYARRIGIRSVASARPVPNVRARAFDIHRTAWHFDRSFHYNLDTIRIDGRLFEGTTGRSPVGR